jgi:hypothetical protein
MHKSRLEKLLNNLLWLHDSEKQDHLREYPELISRKAVEYCLSEAQSWGGRQADVEKEASKELLVWGRSRLDLDQVFYLELRGDLRPEDCFLKRDRRLQYAWTALCIANRMGDDLLKSRARAILDETQLIHRFEVPHEELESIMGIQVGGSHARYLLAIQRVGVAVETKLFRAETSNTGIHVEEAATLEVRPPARQPWQPLSATWPTTVTSGRHVGFA